MMMKIYGVFRQTGSAKPATTRTVDLPDDTLEEVTGLGPSIFLAISKSADIHRAGSTESQLSLLIRRRQTESDSRSGSDVSAPASKLTHLNGAFTHIVIPATGPQQLSVDRFGQNRIVYTVTGDGELVFASDIGLLKQHPAVEFEIDPQAIYNYIFFHVVPSPGSIYKNIFKLPPAHSLEWNGKSCRTRRYWLPDFATRLTESKKAAAMSVVPTITEAVNRCGISHQTGAFLSGGLDSSTVCGAMQSFRSDPAMAFSVGFAEEGYDEIQYASAAAQHFGLDHQVHYITPAEVTATVPRVAEIYDEPFGNSSAVPTFVCASFAKSKGINCLLAGDGGDELFGGNTRYLKQKLFQGYFRIPQILRSGLIEPLFASREQNSVLGRGPMRKLTRYVDQALIPLPDRLETYNLMRMLKLEDVFDHEFLSLVDTDGPLKLLREEWQALSNAHYQDRMLFLDWKFTLADNDLRKVNEMSNLAGVDVCYPLLDNSVVDLAARIPAAVRIPGAKLRHFYKEAVRSFLPEKVLTKSKHGFGLPFGEWARVDPGLREITISALNGLKQRRIFKHEFLDELQRQHMEDHAGFYGNMVWVLMMLELWMDTHGTSV